MPTADTDQQTKADAPPIIHPTAIVEEGATIEPGVTVGPRCTISAQAILRRGVHLVGDVQIAGDTEIGENTVIYPYACIGFGPQHVKIRPGDPIGGVTVGKDCVIREQTTIHAAMHPGARTIIGDRLFLMATGHIGHDCVIGNDVVICNGTLIAGHCEVHDRVFLSGNTAIHQFCRVGTGAMISGGKVSSLDVPPFCTVVEMNTLGGMNVVGMRRNGIPREEITVAREAYRLAFRVRRSREEQIAILDELGEKSAPVKIIADFVRTTKRGVCLGDGRPRPHTMQWYRSDEARRTVAGLGPTGATEADNDDGTDDGMA